MLLVRPTSPVLFKSNALGGGGGLPSTGQESSFVAATEKFLAEKLNSLNVRPGNRNQELMLRSRPSRHIKRESEYWLLFQYL